MEATPPPPSYDINPKKPNQKDFDAAFDTLAQFLFDRYQEHKQQELDQE